MHSLRIGNTRELFWDDYLIDTSRTTAYLKQHAPVPGEVVMTFDRPWEGDGCNYWSVVRLEKGYRMYHLAWNMLNEDGTRHTKDVIRVCCLESSDGIHWTRPMLELRPFGQWAKTNILLDDRDGVFDNFHVFLDENPVCPPEEKFKATARCDKSGYLWCWTSADGYSWKKAWKMTDKGTFDSQNVAFWSPEHGKYFCFTRGFHDLTSEKWWSGTRDIRCMTSADFHTWTEPVLLDFGNSEDLALYTNGVSRYPRAPQMMLGFPTRYIERREWTENFDQLTGADARKKRMTIQPRFGLAATDCVLMTSRDGVRWNRGSEAWITPGIERDGNWVYGDCYPAVGMIQTPSPLPGAPDEYSLFVKEGHWSQKPALLRRYTVRMDGFRSCRADNTPCTLVTKPLVYEGGRLHLNFSTSAKGSIHVTLHCGDAQLHSCELFGNTLDRIVPFDGDLAPFSGKEITLEFTMSDADLYSMQFTQ